VPTYDYQCRSCGVITEVIHSMTADGPTTCPECGGSLRRVFNPAGIIFKGSGFYKTDSRHAKSGSPSAESGASTTTSTASSGSDGGSGGDGASKKVPRATPSDGGAAS
jgi:putative FmdB family regulatory protein